MKNNYALYALHPRYKSFEELLEGNAERFGHRLAVSYRKSPRDKEPICISFREFSRNVRALASEAVKMGMSGKHCALVGGLSYEWLCTYIALQMIGAVVVPLDREWTADELSATIKFAECDFMFCDNDLEEKREHILKDNGLTVIGMRDPSEQGVIDMIKRGDPYWRYVGHLDTRAMSALVFTSGTTGKGKGVMLCQDGILESVYSGLRILRAGERSVVALPPHHTFGSNIGIIALLYAGSSLYLSSGVKYILHEMKEFKPDFMVLVPLYLETFHKRIAASLKEQGKERTVATAKKMSNGLRHINIDMRRKLFAKILEAFGGELRFIACGGAPLRPDLVKDFEDIGVQIINGYGITECSPLISATRNEFNPVGSIGVLIPSMDMKIDAPNEYGEGEICVRGSNVMLGYYKDPDATAAVMDDDGYFHTGDIGRMDGEVIYITGRIKNLIILSNGKNVYPEEIETAISAIPGVNDVVVYEGVSRRGNEYNQIVAEIYPDKELLEKNGVEDIFDYFKKHAAEYNRSAVKYKQIGIVKVRNDEFPKNTLRKITRFKLDMSIE